MITIILLILTHAITNRVKTVAVALLLIPSLCFSQYTDPERIHKGDPAKIIISNILSISFNAAGQAYDLKGNKDLGHALNAMSIGIMITSPFYIHYEKSLWYDYVLSNVFMRIGLFDPVHNWVSGQPLTYVGGDNVWDRTVSHVDPAGMTFIRGCSLIIGVAIPINELGWRIPFVKN